MRTDLHLQLQVRERPGNLLLTVIVTACCMTAVFGCAQAAGRSTARDLLPLPGIKNDCSTCHVMEGAQRSDRLNKPLSALCLECHPDRQAPSEHTVDILPPMKVSGLPLTDGKITCITCHDPHANRYGSLLRLKEHDLCLVCHLL